MAIDLDSGDGLFDVLGALIKTRTDIMDNFQTAIETRFRAHMGTVNNAYAETISRLLGSIDTDQLSVASVLQRIDEVGKELLIKMVDDSESLAQKDLPHAITALKDYMETNSEGLEESAPSASVGESGLVGGDGKMMYALVDRNGDALNHVRAETLRVKCINDAQGGGGTEAGSEIFHVYGEQPIPSVHPDWPGGTGYHRTGIECARASMNAGPKVGQTLVQNGNFEEFSSNLPVNWETIAGTPGTHFDSNATAFNGSLAFEFTGDGSTLAGIKQQFNDQANGTVGRLKPNTVYVISFWAKNAVAGGNTGVYAVRVRSQSGGTTMSVQPYDAAASTIDAEVSIDISTLNTTYAHQWGAFVTPADFAGDDYEIAIIQTTAIANTKITLIDELIIREMVQAYPNGPYLAIVRGDSNFVRDDEFTLAVTQNNSKGDFVFDLDRMFGLQEMGLTLPTLATQTVNDSLIT